MSDKSKFAIKVKLIDSDNPAACKLGPIYPAAIAAWPRWRGKTITVGAPFVPTRADCDTDLVWPILDRDFARDSGYYGPVTVCRHMIEAGD